MNNFIYRYRFLSFILAIVVYAILILGTVLEKGNFIYFPLLVVAWAITLFSTYKYFWLLKEGN